MRYFLTGGTGFIGRHLVDTLLDRDHEVVCLVRSMERARILPEEVERHSGDVTDKASMREGIRGVDGVIHLAAWYQVGVADHETATQVNVRGTRNVLELMDELDIPKGVYTSSLAVNSDTHGEVVDESYRHEGQHLSLYDRTKWQAHYEVAQPMIESGVPLTIVMPGAVYGPGDRGPMWHLWEAYLRESLLAIPREAGYCWGHVDDTVEAMIDAMVLGKPGETYIIAGEPYTLVEIMEMAASITDIPPPRAVSPAIFRMLSRVMAPIERMVSVPPSYSAEALRVLAGTTYWGDNSKATKELNLTHRPVAEGLRETLRYELERFDG